MTEIFADKENPKPTDAIIIRTDAPNEDEFIIELANSITECLESFGAIEGTLVLRKILLFSADICASFRGYKTTIQKKTVMMAGNLAVAEMKLLGSYDFGHKE